ncbi:TMV resistance N [Gossypium arboreum]|uniref:TMV resistance N n=1 Tax=Gossypium arboreum TaxID=29729 RepID=A0A0B0PVW8_GOSAR|nr:TMV resistance N [Gossypium arboreum]
MLSLPSTSSSNSRKKYDVFLSFRGEDTRRNFTDHLYAALKRRWIVTFRDDQKLEAGEEIAPELLKAIQESWCSVIVFSQTYAFSSWCLEELAEIVKQHKNDGHKVFPIFYDVDPSDLRNQKGKVKEAFAKHEERYKEESEKIQRWRNALILVAGVKGWHLSNRESSKMLNLSVDAFSKMKKLRLLKVLCLSNCDYLKFLSNELRLLDWKGCPLKSLPSSFQPDNLIALLLPYNRIQQLWKGNRLLCKLKLMNLEGSQNLIKTPDFTTASNLEVLTLKGCTKLVDVHPSIAVLKSLKVLNLRDCKSLRSLPTIIGMESLETLILSGCSSLVRFPEIDRKTKRLKTLDLSGCYRVENLSENLQHAKFLEELDFSETAITEPPPFIFQFKNLKVLSFNGCKRGRTNSIAPMLPSLSGLSSLGKLNLRDRNLCEGDIPPDISGLSSLKELDLSGNNFTSIPASLTRLSKLEDLILSNCNICTLGEADIHGLSSLKWLFLKGNNFITVPLALTQLTKLKLLELSNCMKLNSLPELPTSIEDVRLDGCSSLEVVASPSKVCNLVDMAAIRAFNCFKLAENINALTLLRKHLKAFANSRKMFDIIMPGSEIPEWFSQQKGDFFIKIPLPINLQEDSEWIGVACCCIFVNNDASRDVGFIDCGALMYGRNRRLIERRGWLVDKYGGCETNNLRTTDCLDHKRDGLHVYFNGHSLKVKKCGVRIVYEKDLEEIKELQCHTPQSSPNFEHIHQHSAHNHGSVEPPSFNIREGDIPSDISCRSSLKELDLSGNNFISIPVSLTRLSKLLFLRFSNCRELESLPELLATIMNVKIDGCASLEVVAPPSPSKGKSMRGTEMIESIIIDNKRESSKMLNLSVDAFSKMKKLRLLKVLCLSNCDYLKFLSNELRLLDWKGCPLKSLPSSFQPDNLIALLLPYNRIQQLWKGNRLLCKLKLMNLEGSQNLIKTPDFTTASNLEVLTLKGCTKLVDVHPSIAVLKSLKVLNLRDCKSLRSLPTIIGMESLETLILSGCSSLVRFPEIDRKTKRLKTLDLSGCYRVENLSENLQHAKFLEELDFSETAITEPPPFIFQFKNLKVLSFNGCKRGRTNSIAPMLPSLSGLSSLGKLNLRDRNLCEGDIPPDISGLSSLKELDLSGNNFTSIPASLTRLSKLEDLILSNCNICTLGEADIHGLSSLKWLFLKGNNFITVPLALTQLTKLKLLELSNCMKLNSLPELPTSIEDVRLDGCSSLEVVASPSKVCNLVDMAAIRAFNCFKLAENINALTLLRKHLKAFANSRKMFDIIMPGSEIPEWFSQQKGDFFIKIPLPINLQEDSEWIGVACCCIFVNNDASRDVGFIDCGALMYGRNRRLIERRGWLVGKRFSYPILKDHIFLRYWSRDKLYPFSLKDKYGGCETNNLRTTDCLDHKRDGLHVYFNGHSLKVKKCGVRIVYEKDLEEIKELKSYFIISLTNDKIKA